MDKKYVEIRARHTSASEVDFAALSRELESADLGNSYNGLADIGGGAYRAMFAERVRPAQRDAVLAVALAHTGEERHLGRSRVRASGRVREHMAELRAQGFEWPAASNRMYPLDALTLAELAGGSEFYTTYPVVFRSLDGRHAATLATQPELLVFAQAAWARLRDIRAIEGTHLRAIAQAETPEAVRAVVGAL